MHSNTPRRNQSVRRPPPPIAPPPPRSSSLLAGKYPNPTSPGHPLEERTVKKLQKAKPLTLSEGTPILEACKKMASRRVDAALITDSNGLLSGILTAEDVAKRIVAEGLRPEQTNVTRAMTKDPVFIMADSPSTQAMQKMVQGKFRHLPVVENDEVIAMMDITKFLFDAISKMEKVAEQGHAIAAAVEGVERQLGNDIPGTVASARHAFMENLWDKMFKPSLSTIIPENAVVPVVSPSDSVLLAAQKMRDFKVNSVVVMLGESLQGIFTSKDLALRVVAQSFAPEVTQVEKVMTANPECATLETSILDALHSMHNGKFLHIPVLDKDGQIAACLDVLQLTHAAISMVEGNGGSLNEVANTMMHRFWDSTMHPLEEEYEYHGSDMSNVTAGHEMGEPKQNMAMMMSPPHVSNSFFFKLEDRKGRVHRFSCVLESLEELICAVTQRIGIENEKDTIQLLYEDDEGDKVLLLTDSDLFGALYHAKSAGFKVIKLHIDDGSDSKVETIVKAEHNSSSQNGWSTFQVGLIASAISLASFAIVANLKHSSN